MDLPVEPEVQQQPSHRRRPLTNDSSNTRAGNAHGRTAQPPLDQQPVEENIDQAGDHIGAHREIRLPAPPLSGVDGQIDDVKKNATHDNAKIFGRAVVGIRAAAYQPHQRVGQRRTERTNHDCARAGKKQRRQQNPMCIQPILLPLSSRDQGIDCNIDR